MLFNSLEFLIFFPVVVCVCFLLPVGIWGLGYDVTSFIYFQV